MSTVVLDAYAKAYPSVSNRMMASVYLSSDLSAPVATIIDTTAGHPQRIYHFPGLPRANYSFSLDEINGAGVPIQNFALFDVVPGSLNTVSVRDDEQIKVGTTVGFVTGATSATFDGTAGAPDYRGWNIVPSELTGRGILVRGLDYSWDSVTGLYTLLQEGDQLQLDNWYNIHFDDIVSGGAGGSVPNANSDFAVRLVTATGSILTGDFGNTVIVEPAGVYVELTLPSITTVTQGRGLKIEVIKFRGANVQCVKFLPNGADVINFLRGYLYAMNNESFEIYRYRRPDMSNEWRVRFTDGNFKNVGSLVSEDAIQSGVYCRQLLDGSVKDKSQFARIYNEHVILLPSTQVCDFDAWSTGNNKYLYSLANSADNAFVNKFHFPDRRGIFERNNSAGKAGDYNVDTLASHRHAVNPPSANSQTGSGKTTTGGDALGADAPIATYYTELTGVSETSPKNYLINKYVLL